MSSKLPLSKLRALFPVRIDLKYKKPKNCLSFFVNSLGDVGFSLRSRAKYVFPLKSSSSGSYSPIKANRRASTIES